jgi:hypothetical protein
VEDGQPTTARIVVQLDHVRWGGPEETKPIVLELYHVLHDFADRYEGLTVEVVGFADDKQPSTLPVRQQ